MTPDSIRMALFPCTYREIDGVANTSRQFAAFAKERGYEFLLVHAGPRDEVVTDGSITRVQLRRGRVKFPLDGHHEFDLLFLRHYPEARAAPARVQPGCHSHHRTERRWNSGNSSGPQSGRHFGGLLANQYSSICPPPRVRASIVLARESVRQIGRRRRIRQLPCGSSLLQNTRGCSSLRIVKWSNCSARPPASPAS